MTLSITDQIYQGAGRKEAMKGFDEFPSFIDAVQEALNMISSCDNGFNLLNEIRNARHEVLILKAGSGGNTCVTATHTLETCNAACYREVLSPNLLFDKLNSFDPGQKEYAVKKCEKLFGAQKPTIPITIGKKTTQIPQAHKAKRDRPHRTDQAVSWAFQMTSVDPTSEKNFQEKLNMVFMLRAGLVGYHIQPHLTPGTGTEAWVVWDPLLDRVGTDLPPKEQAPWMTRPTWVGLAHELIHGWRLATGRCVFNWYMAENYYEEAMTVGLPPYDGCCYTENRFRRSKGIDLRTYYGEETRNQSQYAQKKHGTVEQRLN